MERVIGKKFVMLLVFAFASNALAQPPQNSTQAQIPSAEYEPEQIERTPASLYLTSEEVELRANTRTYSGGQDEDSLKVLDQIRPPQQNADYFHSVNR